MVLDFYWSIDCGGFHYFSGGFNTEFVNWDDQTYIKLNYLVTKPNGYWAEAWNSHFALNYAPLTITSLMINSDIFGFESARSFIITNTLIHLLNVLLVLWFVLLLLKNKFEILLSKAQKPLFLLLLLPCYLLFIPYEWSWLYGYLSVKMYCTASFSWRRVSII